jgi:hypothetical protein
VTLDELLCHCVVLLRIPLRRAATQSLLLRVLRCRVQFGAASTVQTTGRYIVHGEQNIRMREREQDQELESTVRINSWDQEFGSRVRAERWNHGWY